MSFRHQESFDVTSRNIAECIDQIFLVERSRDRRLELITHHVRRAMSTAYRAGIAQASDGGAIKSKRGEVKMTTELSPEDEKLAGKLAGIFYEARQKEGERISALLAPLESARAQNVLEVALARLWRWEVAHHARAAMDGGGAP